MFEVLLRKRWRALPVLVVDPLVVAALKKSSADDSLALQEFVKFELLVGETFF